MRVLYISVALLCLSACKKGPYTCICTDGTNGANTQTYNMGNKDYDDATSQCEQYEHDLNNNAQRYDCFLD